MAKDISWYIESPSDKLKKVNGVSAFGTPTCCGGGFVGMTISGTFYTFNCQTNPAGPQDLCAIAVPNATSWVAEFQRADLSTYTKTSVDFIGGRPARRPTLLMRIANFFKRMFK